MPYQIIISSDDQLSSISTSNSDFSVKLQRPFGVSKAKFKKIVLPFSWYPIDSSNNTLVFNEGGGDLTATILTPTSWTGSALATALKNALDLAGGTYTVTYDSITLKFTVSKNGGGLWTLKFATTNNTIYKILGFNNSDTTYSGANSYTSTNVSYILGPPYLIVKSRAVTNGADDQSQSFYNTSTVGSDSLLSNTKQSFLMIPVNVSPGGLIVYNEGDFTREVEYPVSDNRSDKFFQTIDLQLVNPWTDAAINLNGGDWILELEAWSPIRN